MESPFRGRTRRRGLWPYGWLAGLLLAVPVAALPVVYLVVRFLAPPPESERLARTILITGVFVPLWMALLWWFIRMPTPFLEALQDSFGTMVDRLQETRQARDVQIREERAVREELQSLQRQVIRQERLAAVGLLVSGVAHEVNNPLQAILGFAELLQMQHDLPEQVMRMSNALPGRITIRTRDHDGAVLVEVEDSGPGVAPADEAKLFQPFFTTKPVGEGAGLGLSVSYGIVDSMGGSMGYRRPAGGGALFYFELPAHTA